MFEVDNEEELVSKMSWLTSEERKAMSSLLKLKWEYIDHPIFKDKSCAKKVKALTVATDLTQYEDTWNSIFLNISNIFEEKELEVTNSRLKFDEEQTLFIKYNYARKRSIYNLKVMINNLCEENSHNFLTWGTEATRLEHLIVGANLALVGSMYWRGFQKVAVPRQDLMAEGSWTLLKCVKKFDASRGFKFSTYACRSILTTLSRYAQGQKKHGNHFEYDPSFEKPITSKNIYSEDDIGALRTILASNQADLTDTELGIIDNMLSDEPLLQTEITKILGITLPTIRKLKREALAKLKEEFLLV